MKKMYAIVFFAAIISFSGKVQADFLEELIKSQEGRGIRVTTPEDKQFEKEIKNVDTQLAAAPQLTDISEDNAGQISGLLSAFYTLFFDPVCIRFSTKAVMTSSFERLISWHDALKNKNVVIPWPSDGSGAELKKLLVQALKEICLFGRYSKHREENLVAFKLRLQNILTSIIMDSCFKEWKDQLIDTNEELSLGAFYSWDVTLIKAEFKDSVGLMPLFNKLATTVNREAEQEEAKRHEQEVAIEKQQMAERKKQEAQWLKNLVLKVQQQSPTDNVGRGALYLDCVRVLLDPAYMELPLADRKAIDTINDRFKSLHSIIGRTFMPIFSQEYVDELKLLIAKGFGVIYSPEVGKSGGISLKNHIEFVIKTLMTISPNQTPTENQIKFQWIKPLYLDNQLLTADAKKTMLSLFYSFDFQRWQAAVRTFTLKLLSPAVFAEQESTVIDSEQPSVEAPEAPALPVEEPKKEVEEKKANIDNLDQISKDLIIQSRVGSVAAVEDILAHVDPSQKFALISMTDEKQNTAVHVAAVEGRVDVLTVLLAGLTLNQKFEILTMRQMYGKTPLHLAAAVKNKKPAAVNKLLQGLMPQQKVELIAIKDNNGKTPLNIAQDFNNQAVALTFKEVLSKGGK